MLCPAVHTGMQTAHSWAGQGCTVLHKALLRAAEQTMPSRNGGAELLAHREDDPQSVGLHLAVAGAGGCRLVAQSVLCGQ